MALDYKKEYKDLYIPKFEPSLVNIPAMGFIMVDGMGNPNIEGGEYQQSIELLYGLCYTIKMSKMSGKQPEGYFDYVVPPLEGLWWLNDDSYYDLSRKDDLCWISMIRQPEFVSQEVFDWACAETAKKKPHLNLSKARLKIYHEGLCVQMMHLGPFDEEPETVARINEFIKVNGYQNAISDTLPDGMIKRHHEIYISDFRKTEPHKLRTVIRHPVKVE